MHHLLTITCPVWRASARCRRPTVGQFLTWAKFSVVAAAALISPVFVFLIAIAVEILIGVVEDAGALPLVAFIVAGAIGSSRLSKLRARPRGGAPIAI
jgi:hypothetical protein